MPDRGYECIDHNPPIQSEPIEMRSNDDLREAYTDRDFLIKVLRRFGSVDDDTGLTQAARWLAEHRECQIGIWTEDNRYRTRLTGPFAGKSYTYQDLEAADE